MRVVRHAVDVPIIIMCRSLTMFVRSKPPKIVIETLFAGRLALTVERSRIVIA